MLGFVHVARSLRSRVYVLWPQDQACPGRFEKCFEYLPGVEFVPSLDEFRLLAKGNPGIRFKGQMSMRRIAARHGVDLTPADVTRLHAELQLKRELAALIDNFSVENDIDYCIGLHIRRTDHVPHLKRMNIPGATDEFFIDIIKRHLKENPFANFYLAADNKATQDKFKSLFPSQIIVYKEIKNAYRHSERHTGLEHAVIDAWLLARCCQFHGSVSSTLSTLVLRLQSAQRPDVFAASHADIDLLDRTYAEFSFNDRAVVEQRLERERTNRNKKNDGNVSDE